MRKYDLNRVRFYSKEDMSGGNNLSKSEPILRGDIKLVYSDINDVLELYNIKKYLDNDLFLQSWTEDDIASFKKKSIQIGKVIGQFFSSIDDSNIVSLYGDVLGDYLDAFWEVVNNQKAFKKISKENFKVILSSDPHIIHVILQNKNLVDYYQSEIKEFLLGYSKSAEILLSIYEVKHDLRVKAKFLPKSLSIADKEKIIVNYLDSEDVNMNYLELIQNARNRADLIISSRTRLKAKRLNESEIKNFFDQNEGFRYGISVEFSEKVSKIKDGYIDDSHTAHYVYNTNFIKENNTPYLLFQNFKYLFEYLDSESRINLISKESQIESLESIMGLRSVNEYKVGAAFSYSEITSQAQIAVYNKVLSELGTSLEEILQHVFTVDFHERFGFAENALFSIPSATTYLEKVRLLAPELESILKQFKLFVEDGSIDFELLQMSSSPTAIKEIPSLNQKKYIYLNKDNEEAVSCSNIFFSDQTLLAYIEPFKGKEYRTFFDLLANEDVKLSSYEEFQKPMINYLIDKEFLYIDDADYIQFTNHQRVLILKDLHDNEFASFYHYPIPFQKEAEQMAIESMVVFDSSLFSKPEQAYFNYFLNKSEFTNGLDLRNSYLHGTQANPDDVRKHEYSYFTYLKLLVLIMLKIDDDLQISNRIEKH